jgi:lactoylglutathione lyase
VQVGTGFSHLVVQVDELAATIEALAQAGLPPGPERHPAGPEGPRTSWLTDPDGYRIELVQWPAGIPTGSAPPTSISLVPANPVIQSRAAGTSRP